MTSVSHGKRILSLSTVVLLCFSLFCAVLVPGPTARAQEQSNDGSKPYLVTAVSVEQGGKRTSAYEAGKPIEIIFRLHNPSVDVPAGVPLHIQLYDPDGNLIDNSTIYSEEDESSTDDNEFPVIATYSFTPQTVGDYVLAWKGAYESLYADDNIRVKVRPSPEYTFEVEGKTATAIVDSLSKLDFVRSVELDSEEKTLSITIDQMDYWTRFEVQMPYALLGDPYVVRVDGEIIDVVEGTGCGPWGDGPNIACINKRADYARIFLPVREGVSHFEIVGTTAIPEFPYHVVLIASIVIGTIVVIGRMGLVSRFYGNGR